MKPQKHRIFRAPENIAERSRDRCIFLAGSIEMGEAENWQEKMEKYFLGREWNVFNPRRHDWDPTWEQEQTNPNFYQQVHWELNALETADKIFVYFDPNTKSPITLLELGLYAQCPSKKLAAVVCPQGFWKKGNVDIICERYNIPLYSSLDDFIERNLYIL